MKRRARRWLPYITLTAFMCLLVAGVQWAAWTLRGNADAKTTHACGTYTITGTTVAGSSYDMPVTYCGKGIRAGRWSCPAAMPGQIPSRIECEVTP